MPEEEDVGIDVEEEKVGEPHKTVAKFRNPDILGSEDQLATH